MGPPMLLQTRNVFLGGVYAESACSRLGRDGFLRAARVGPVDEQQGRCKRVPTDRSKSMTRAGSASGLRTIRHCVSPGASAQERSFGCGPKHLPKASLLPDTASRSGKLLALQNLAAEVAVEPVSSELGISFHSAERGGGVSFRVWAPHAESACIELEDGTQLPLSRSENDTWAARFPAGVLEHGTRYQILLVNGDELLERRDPYARSTDYDSNWCFVDNPASYDWQCKTWELPAFADYIIYEMHVGSFTPEGTFASAIARLDHVAALGFTAVQVMPVTEHSDAWGYNPRQLMSIHGALGGPTALRDFVDAAHARGLAVIVDVVLHHGAVDGNALWNYDGWGPDLNGGIYHEGAPDTPWGRAFAFWKGEVRAMALAACAMYLRDFNCDGLRFDSANDLPTFVTQEITWNLKQEFPGRILTAEVTPENPFAQKECGFDSIWVHSGYFDIIQQHRALGRGHHGGGDWADGWNLPRLRTVMGLHYGFENPTQCIKYLLGSHDQVGCRKGGAWYEDYIMIGGQHRYAVDQFGGGRTDPHSRASVMTWYVANVTAAGLPMMFMGTEFSQGGWWDITEERRIQWGFSEDEIGQQMMELVKDAHALRAKHAPLRTGWANILHEDRPNGVLAFERVEGIERIVIVVNAGRSSWQAGEYGCWVREGVFEEVLCSADAKYGGWEGSVSNKGQQLVSHDGKLWINVPMQSAIVFQAVG